MEDCNSSQELIKENRNLRERLLEAEETLRAIQRGEVDALVIDRPEGTRLYTLTGADHGYQVLVESITEGALILAPDDSIYYCNRALGEMLGLPIPNIIGRKLDPFVDSEAREQLMRLIEKGRNSGASKGEFQMMRNDGSLLSVNVSLNRMNTGEFEGICAVITDLTEQKRIEEELRKHHAELESLVNERTADLTRAFSELRTHQIQLKMQNEELRRVGHDLEISRSRYVDLYDFAPVGYLSLNKNGQIIDLNLTAARQLGIERGRLIDAHFQYFVFRPDLQGFLSHLKEVFNKRERQISEIRLTRKDGEQFYARLESVYMEGEDDAGLCRTIISDVTERKRIEEELRASEEKFRTFFNTTAVGAAQISTEGRFIEANNRLCEITGYSREELLEKTTIDLIHFDDRTANLKPLSDYLIGKCNEYVAEKRYIRKDGSIIWVNVFAALTRDHLGNPLRSAGIIQDITERKQMEEELRRSRNELELRVQERTAELVSVNESLQKQAALLDLSHDAIFVEDSFEVISFWNKGAEDLYGFTREQAVGNVAYELLQTRFPESHEQVMNEAINKGQWAGELRQKTSKGEEIVVESRWALRRGENGEPTGFLQVNRDITAKKLAEEALRTNMARLELVNSELQEFAFVAAHDLQEPLRKIMTYSLMAQKEYALVLDTAGKDYLDRVINSASRMRQLLRDLLDFSRVATRPEPTKKIDFAKIVRKAADVFETPAKETGCQIEIENLPVIEADESQMLQLFQNLIGNALKFRSDAAPHVRVYGRYDGEEACQIFVKDNGIGFDQKHAERIFKPFQRLHNRDRFEGTGMGLAICRKIVERHGGSIQAEGELGKGATFIIRLPMKQMRLELINV